MSYWWVWCISGAPNALGNCWRFLSLGLRCVISCKDDAMLPVWGVILYSNRPETHGFLSLPALFINFLATPTTLSAKPLALGGGKHGLGNAAN